MTARTGPSPPLAAGPAEAYLAEIAAWLPGPARDHPAILAEFRAGLLDAADAHRSRGLPAGEAARAAIAEFGDSRQVAAAFGPELAARQARRVALTLLATGPLIGLLWVATALASHLGVRRVPPWQWAGLLPVSKAAIPLAAAVIVVTIVAALSAIAATGPLIRWLPARSGYASAAAAVAGVGATAADAIILAILAGQLTTAPGSVSPLPVTAAAAASLTRLALASRAARRCRSTRAALT
jgi:hypothetical protein